MDNGWFGFALAMGVFLLAHALPARPRLKARIVAVTGQAGFARWYSALSIGLLAAYALAGADPLSFGSRAAPFDPARPGIAGVSRHPVLLALALWALLIVPQPLVIGVAPLAIGP